MSDIKPSDLRHIAAETNIRKHILRDGCEQAADKIERLESELEKHQWRTDIENAPRGGTRFLVCLGSFGPMTAHYDQMSHNDEYLAIHSLHPLPFEPTHWKPLDKPKQPQNGE